MTSINFERRQILCTGVRDLPVFKGVGGIMLITAGLEELPEVAVSGVERDRAATMERISARRFLAGRRLTRAVFCKLTGADPENVELCLDGNGKPYLPEKGYHFSIAHSGETVAVAVSRSIIGVDLETERPVDASALARRFFSRDEAAFLEAYPDPAHFFRFWTCREAAVKADGRGLSKLLGQTRVAMEPFSPGGGIDVRIGAERWTAFHWSVRDRLHLALAFQKLPSLISWCDLRR